MRVAWTNLAPTLIAIAFFSGSALADQNTKPAAPTVNGKNVPDDSSAKNVVGEYYMMGNIKRPGVYSTTGRHITIRQAIVAAGGFDKATNPNASVGIISRLPNNEESFVLIDLIQLMNPKSGLDRILAPNDIVQVTIKDAPEAPIATGDLISLTVGNFAGPHAGTSFEKRVDKAGNISVPLVGPCHVAGLSFTDAENAIQKMLFDSNLIEQTLVSIRRLEPAAKASITPGPIQPDDRLTIRYWNLPDGAEQRATIRVDKDGTIDLPMIGRVVVAKLTEAEAEKNIGDVAKSAKFSDKPLVNVQRLGAYRAADEL